MGLLADAKLPDGDGIFFILGVVALGAAAVLIQLGFTIRDLLRERRR